MLCNNDVKAAARRKEASWKEVKAATNEKAKQRCKEAYRARRMVQDRSE